MALTKEDLRAVMSGTLENRVEELRKILGYPVKEFDREGSRFWYLRPGESVEEAADTCPIAVGFYAELNEGGDHDIRQLLTSKEQQNEIYGHYTSRFSEQQPVMYLLLPAANLQGRVALVLPTEGGLRQRQIQIFDWSDRELPGRLSRLQQGTLSIADRLTALIPQVDWVFYPGVKTAGKLAQLMADIARDIEQAIPAVHQAQGKDGDLDKLYKSFQKELLPTLKLQADNEKDYSFADIYAQTVAYGLFTARVFSYLKFQRDKEKYPIEPEFYRDTAWKNLPETNPFLRKLFEDISSQKPEQLGQDLVGAVSELLSVLRAAEMDAVLSDFEQKIGQEDIIIRFYEDFLKAYKPQMRERRGVYYTPEPVVSYMVRSVDILLKDKFNKPLGLADPEVMILDPACGTGTFLLWICQLIYQRFQESPEALTEGLADKSWSGYVKERLLPRIFGFELLMAPYAIAHLKLSLFLEETGYQFDSGKRLGVYLTNALEQAAPDKPEIPLEEFIAEEGEAALEIKRNKPIMAIIGNPPYSPSIFEGEWIMGLMDDYKKALNEKKSDLIREEWKFLRFAQHKIVNLGQGIASFVINNTFIDAITHRVLRESILSSFSEIKVVDLHGSIKRSQKAPDGSKDENIFDIQQGVSIFFGAKTPTLKCKKSSQIVFGEVYGSHQMKQDYLSENQIVTTSWQQITPEASNSFFFCPKDLSFLTEYNQGYRVVEIFSEYVSGIQTKRDSITIAYLQDDLLRTTQDLLELDTEKFRIKYQLPADGRDWSIDWARTSLKSVQSVQNNFKKILYKPFDIRWTCYTNKSKGFLAYPRYDVLKHMILGDNLALITMRQIVNQEYSHFGVTNRIASHGTFYLGNKGQDYIFPLYLYSDTNNLQQSVLEEQRRPNLSQNFLNAITSKLGYTPTAEVIFYYIYAIFHSPTYRTRYAEFLKIDFPRVPLTSNDRLFRQLAAYGEELVALHLMKSLKLDNTITQFCDHGGDRVVDAGHPKYPQGDVIINKKGDRFSRVPENVWNFYIGGYQVCHKWLKDRKGRTLSNEDILHYQKIVIALKETINLMTKIDRAIPGFPIQ